MLHRWVKQAAVDPQHAVCQLALNTGSPSVRVAKRRARAVRRSGDSDDMNAIPELPMPKRLLPFIPSSLRDIAIAPKSKQATVMAGPRSASSCCPVYRRYLDRTHGSYERCLADLP